MRVAAIAALAALLLGWAFSHVVSGPAFEGIVGFLAEKVTWGQIGKIAVEVLVVVPIAFLIEGLGVGWRRSSFRRLLFRRSASSRTDLLIYAAGELRTPNVVIAVVGFLGFTGMTFLGNGLLAERLGIDDLTRIDDPVLGFVIFLIVRDFSYYWYHRLQHTRILWPLHRMHHSAREFTVLTSYRTNLLGEVLLGSFQAIPLSLLTLPVESFLVGQFLVVMHGHLTHSELRSTWGWFGRWVLYSPLHHRQHHGLRPTEYKTNFATMPLWDRMFGTYMTPSGRDIRIGVDHPAYDTVAGCARMYLMELYETGRLILGLPVADPSVPQQAGAPLSHPLAVPANGGTVADAPG